MDPTLIRDADPAGVVVFFLILAAILAGSLFFNRSTNGDWVDEAHGRGSVEDDWGWPTSS